MTVQVSNQKRASIQGCFSPLSLGEEAKRRIWGPKAEKRNVCSGCTAQVPNLRTEWVDSPLGAGGRERENN